MNSNIIRFINNIYDLIIIFLFFYKINDDSSISQGYVLEDIGKSFPDKVIVFSFDIEYFEEPMLETLKKQFGVTKAPTSVINNVIIIDELVYTGQINQTINRIITQMNNNDEPINIFLDLSKAIDTIDHNILLNKLTYYGLNGSTLQLFRSYLQNRKQYTEIEQINSDILSITIGVPKGSILGPLLFIIYINDFSQPSQLFNFVMYADDTTLSSS